MSGMNLFNSLNGSDDSYVDRPILVVADRWNHDCSATDERVGVRSVPVCQSLTDSTVEHLVSDRSDGVGGGLITPFKKIAVAVWVSSE